MFGIQSEDPVLQRLGNPKSAVSIGFAELMGVVWEIIDPI